MNDELRSKVQWRDLTHLTPREVFNELALPLPWLAGSMVSFHQGWVVLGAFCAFYFFLTGLRQSHGAQHFTLGVSRRAHHWILFALSALMMGSMHAVQVTHLNHHRHCLDDHDGEGKIALEPAWKALIGGPLFFLRLHANAWRRGDARARRWIAAEIILIVLLAFYAATAPATGVACHLSAMLVGECFTGFFAVWTVHHDCADPNGRTQRGAWLNRMTYNMFYHREHHLYPGVPTGHLAQLSHRIADQEKTTKPFEVIPTARWKEQLV